MLYIFLYFYIFIIIFLYRKVLLECFLRFNSTQSQYSDSMTKRPTNAGIEEAKILARKYFQTKTQAVISYVQHMYRTKYDKELPIY